ncbi:MAG: major facilitator superfamily 1 [Chloroflexi bacterium]|nr:major facilitator superfamily 1 [Chloroflexota bacterium]
MSEERPSLRRAVVALQHRDFSLFYLSAMVAGIGSQLANTANILQIYELTGSALQLGLTGLARAIPTIALSLVGGVVADRVDRRKFIMIMQTFNGCIALALFGLTALELTQVWHIYLAVFLNAASSALASPARSALVPNLVPRHHLMNALALNSTTWQASNVFGPALGGLSTAIFGLAVTYLWDGLAITLTVIALGLMRVGPIAARPRAGAWRSIVEGLAFVKQRSIILVLLVMDSGVVFFGQYKALMPILVALLATGVVLDGGDSREFVRLWTGLLISAPAIGALIGATGVMSLGDVRYKGRYVYGAILAYSVLLFLLVVSPRLQETLLAGGVATGVAVGVSLALAWGASCLLGFSDSVQMLSRNTIIQSITPDELRGRVSAFQSTLTNGVPHLGQASNGAIASILGFPTAIMIGAICCAILVTTLFSSNKEVRSRDVGFVPEPEPEPKPAVGAAS